MASTLLSFTPLSADFTSSASAPVFAARNGHRLLEFADAADKETFFTSHMPQAYASGGLTMVIMWMAKTVTSGNAVFGISFERHADDGHDLDADSFAVEKTVVGVAPSVSGKLQYTTITFANNEIDDVSAGDEQRIRVRVIGTDSSHDIGDPVQIMSVRMSQDSSGGGGGGFFQDGTGLNAAIGRGSVLPTAGGENALAQGSYSSASGINAFGMGYYATANFAHAFAHGHYADAGAAQAFAHGYFTDATAAQAFAHGYFANATAVNAFAHGNSVYASGANSSVFGTLSNNQGVAAFAAGNNCDITAAGDYSANFGLNNSISGAQSLAVGSGHTLSAVNGVALGIGHNIAGSAIFSHGNGNTSGANCLDSLVQGRSLTLGANSEQCLIQGYALTVPASTKHSILQGTGHTFSTGAQCSNSLLVGLNNIINTGSGHTGGVGYNVFTESESWGCGYNIIVKDSSLVVGYDVEASDWLSIVVGQHSRASATATLAHGYYVNAAIAGQRSWGCPDRYSGLADAQGSQIYRYLETIGGTQTTMLTIPLSLDKGYSIRIHLVAYNTTTVAEVASFVYSNAIAYRNAGVAVLLPADPQALTRTDSGGGAVNLLADLVTSTNDILLRVTGEAGETYEWVAIIEMIEVKG